MPTFRNLSKLSQRTRRIFFCEDAHFELLRQVLAQLIEAKRKAHTNELRIWCCAASTGQEPYTIAMVVAETLTNALGWDVKFIATDIDHDVLTRAATGSYTEAEVASVPVDLRKKYFVRSRGDRYIVRNDLKNMIRFAPLNLTQPAYPFQHHFDVIFCRNVLIYFEREMASQVVRKLVGCLNPNGHLFLGHSETGVQRPPGMVTVGSALWRKT